MQSDNGIYYFLGNITSHIIHALPLYEEIGGTFIVLSEKAASEVAKYNVPVKVFDDKPKLFLELSSGIKKTTAYLNKHARVVIFYELYEFSRKATITKPKVFLTHGNMLKSYMAMNPNRKKIVQDYDYIAGIGPYLKDRFIHEDGIEPERIVDLGIARTDSLYTHKGKVFLPKALQKELGFNKNPIISYMPTYWGVSSVHHLGKEIVRFFPDNYNLLFRPHPQTPSHIIDEYKRIIGTRTNIVYAPEGKFPTLGLTEALALSSAIIGDVSSVTLEAILTDKPLVFAYDDITNKQQEKDYDAIKEVVRFSNELTILNVRQIEYILENSLSRGIATKTWAMTRNRTFFNPDGDSVDTINKFVENF